MSHITHVTTAGSGVMGSQVSWMAAWHGKTVVAYDAFEAGLDKGQQFHADYARHFIDKRGATPAQVKAAQSRLRYTTDLADALKDADLIIEQVPENLEIKREFWTKASALASADTIFAVNTSTLLPTAIASAVTHPERFTTLHFCVDVWDAHVGEIMKLPQTSDQVFNTMCEFAKEIGLVPVPIAMEHKGYVLNSMLIPFVFATLDLMQKGVCSPQTLDRTWRICMGDGVGPAEMLDKIGLNVCYQITRDLGNAGDKRMTELAEYIHREFIQTGKTGMRAGAGFYTYPDPEFARPDFLHPTAGQS